mmetsp:Transcript_24085/g.65669  ORF Transcript_24085/g.65669 Transcript_24085/m.65669 type:complete len:228 (-) Transcript_24085:419-1102(-)
MRLSLSWPSGCGHSRVRSQLATSLVGTAASGLSNSFSTTWLGSPAPGLMLTVLAVAASELAPSLFSTSAPANTRPTSSTPSRARSSQSAVTSSRVSSGLPARFSMSGRISYFSICVGFAKSFRKFLVGSSLNSGRKRLGRSASALGSTTRAMLWLRSASSSSRFIRSRISLASRKQLLSMNECSWAFFFGFGLFGDTLSRLGTTSSALMRSSSFTPCWSRSSTCGAW